MARLGELVDLSLFATSPSDDRHFATAYISPTDRNVQDVPCYVAQRQINISQRGNYVMKPLPPLPRSRLCTRRPRARRSEPASRCILDRMKRSKTDEQGGEWKPTLQQRRITTTTPLLTLSSPSSNLEERGERRERDPRPTMIWMPEDQMWLTQDRAGVNPNPHVWSYMPPPNHADYRYTRSEPPSEPSALYDLPPLSPTHDRSMNMEESPDGIRSQFLRLMRSDEDERLSSLFQAAIQSVPPMTDPSPSSPPATYTIDEQWISHHPSLDQADSWSEMSLPESYHTARASLGEESRSLYSRIARNNPWSEPEDDVLENLSLEEPRSVVSQLTPEDSWRDDDYRVGFSPLSYEASWYARPRGMARSQSTFN